MRAKEFLKENDGNKPLTINIPISITLPSEIMIGGTNPRKEAVKPGDLPEVPIHVFPLQQEFELKKHEAGYSSPVVNQILHDKGALSDKQGQTDFDLVENFDWLKEEFKNSKKN